MPGGTASWPAPTPATRSCSRRTGSSTSATRCALALRLVRTSAGRPGGAPARGSGTSSSTSSRTRTGPSRSWSRSSPSRTATSRSSATTTSRSTSSAARRSATSSSSGTATARPGPSSCAATTARSRRSSTRRTGSSATTTRTGSRSGPAISKRLRPVRATADEPPVRHEAFATHGEEADWIAAEIGRRIAAGAQPARPSPSSSGRTPRRPDPAQPQRRPASRGGSPGRRACTRGRRCGSCSRSCGRSLTRVVGVDVYALATVEPYGLGGEDLTAIVNTARRRNRSVWDVLEELERQPGILRLSPETRDRRRPPRRRPAALHRARPRAAGRRGAVRVPAGLRGWLARLAASDSVAAEEALRNIARFFDIVRAQSSLLADDRAVFVARHLQTLIEAGDDPPTADIDPDADAVAVMTVHKAKGLEFPVVYLPGLVAGRFPTHAPARAARAAARARQRDAAGGRLPAPGGAPPVLRRDDPGPRRARPVARRRLRRRRRPATLAVRARGARPAAAGGRARGGRDRDEPARADRGRSARTHEAAPVPVGPRRAAPAVLLRGRRLPDLPAEVQVRPRAARAHRAAPLADLRRRRSTRRSRSSTGATRAATS